MNPLLCLPVLLAATTVHTGGPGILSPDHPRAGAPLQLTYDTTAANARFRAGDAVHATVAFFTARGMDVSSVPLVDPGDGRLSGRIAVPADATNVVCNFVTRFAHDRAAEVSAMVYDDGGNPVRGARLRTVYERGARVGEIVDAELRSFPDSLAAYRTRWHITGFRDTRDVLVGMVRTDLATLGDASSPDGLWARSYGHMVLGEERQARALLLDLLTKHPTTWAAARAVSDYEYQAYTQRLPESATAEVGELKAKVIAAHPEIWFARDEVRVLSARGALSLPATRAICEAWMRDRPLHPEPKLVLARALLRDRVELDHAATLAIQAVNGYLVGDMRLSGDYAGGMTRMMIGSAYLTATEIEMARGGHARALAFARASIAVSSTTSSKAHETEARVWEGIGNRPKAALAWARALCAGSTGARASLLRLHADGGGEPDGFDAHLAKLLAKADPGVRPPAAPFSATDLDGRKLELTALRGKVVVLNFWGLGCAPCKVEIPDLSKLARDYRDREVEFIAFATDEAAKLRDYLAEHPFDYRVVAAAGRVVGAYRVRAFPTHVIIDRRGRVAATFVGGGEGADARLRPIIERLLAE